MLSDTELLTRYRLHRDESAFTEIVRRYLGAVLRIAQNTLEGEKHLTADVAQSVFLDLARKVEDVEKRCCGGRSLIGWLYTGTVFAAARFKRSERRRQFHETEAFSQLEQDQFVAGAPNWDEIRSLLDSAMEGLVEPERDAILLRFFAGRSLRDVGMAIGVSEDAARKRVDRALDRMRSWMEQRGVRTTGMALASGMTFHLSADTSGISVDEVADSVLQQVCGTSRLGRKSATSNSSQSPLSIKVAFWLVVLLVVVITRFESDSSGRNPKPLPDSGVKTTASALPPGERASPSLDHREERLIRVPKDLLKRMDVDALVFGKSSSSAFVLSDTFVRLFLVSDSEAESVETSLADAFHAARLEFQRHLSFIGTDEIPLLQSAGVQVFERMNFRLHPYPMELRRIQDVLKHQIDSALGPERARFAEAYNLQAYYDSQEFKSPGDTDRERPDDWILAYRLVETKEGAFVELQQFRPDGVGGGVLDPDMDVYAPTEMIAVLGRWRRWCDQRNRERGEAESFALHSSRSSVRTPAHRSTASSRARQSGRTWDESSPFVEIPMDLLLSVGLPGLNDDESLADHTKILCQLTQEDAEFVEGLWADIRRRIVQLELDHFTRVQQPGDVFLLGSISSEVAAIRNEWRRRLSDRFGEDRFLLLDNMIRTPLSLEARARVRLSDQVAPAPWEPTVDWLGLGDEEWIVEFGNEFEAIFHSTQNSSHKGGFYKSTLESVPIRWRHLVRKAKQEAN